MMTNTLKQHLQHLHLSGLLSSLELRLQEAEANRLPHAQFLELLLQDEINVRHQRMLARRRKSADFREARSLENFDFGFNPSINRAQIYELAACQFVRQHRDVLLVGPPGVGKSHLVQAIGLEVLKAGFVVLYRSIFDLVRELLTQETLAGEARLLNKYLKPDLPIIDDMGLKILPSKSGEILLEIIMRRYENRSISTSFGRWFDRTPSPIPLLLALVMTISGYALLSVTTNLYLLILIAGLPLGTSLAVFPQLFALAKGHLDR